MFRNGLLLSFAAVLLQIAVFLQPLLPAQYQIAPVCETITRALFEQPNHSGLTTLVHHAHHVSTSHALHEHHESKRYVESSHSGHDHHDPNHQCQYCTVFGNLILPPELNVKEVFVRLNIRLIAFQKAFKHIYFDLQRLFLLPQGRAPPLFS